MRRRAAEFRRRRCSCGVTRAAWSSLSVKISGADRSWHRPHRKTPLCRGREVPDGRCRRSRQIRRSTAAMPSRRRSSAPRSLDGRRLRAYRVSWPGEQQRREEIGIERLVGADFVGAGKVHVLEASQGLDDAILGAGDDAEFLAFDVPGDLCHLERPERGRGGCRAPAVSPAGWRSNR